MNVAARATWAPGCGSRHGSAWSPCAIPIRISSCQAGWNSTSSMRLPKRSWVRSFGGFSFASTPQRIVSARPQIAPSSRDPVVRPSRRPRARTASTSGAVGLEDVVVLERRRLVEDLVGRGAGAVLGGGHRAIVSGARLPAGRPLELGPRRQLGIAPSETVSRIGRTSSAGLDVSASKLARSTPVDAPSQPALVDHIAGPRDVVRGRRRRPARAVSAELAGRLQPPRRRIM